MKTKKKFDCVKMKDEAQMRRAQRLSSLTSQDRMAFYREAHEALERRQKELKALAERDPDRSLPAAGSEA